MKHSYWLCSRGFSRLLRRPLESTEVAGAYYCCLCKEFVKKRDEPSAFGNRLLHPRGGVAALCAGLSQMEARGQKVELG